MRNYLFLFLTFLFFNSCEWGKDATPSIQGITIKAVDSQNDNADISNVRILLKSALKNDTQTTDGEGSYQWDGLQIGNYIVTLEHSDYLSDSREISVSDGQMNNQIFQLRPKSKLEVNPGTINFNNENKTETVYFKNKSTVGDLVLNIEGLESWLKVSESKITVPSNQQKAVSFIADTKGIGFDTYSSKVLINYTVNGRNDNTDFTAYLNLSNPNSPSCETLIPTGITQNSCDISGLISSTGNNPIIESGILWSESPDLKVNNSSKEIVEGGNIGKFTLTAKNLSPGKTYYARAYAKNTIGIGYGEVKEFETSKTITEPSLILYEPTNISANSAVLNAIVSNNGGSNITSHGFCWNTSGNPTLNDNKTLVNISEKGELKYNLTNLNQGLVYYVRGFGINSLGENNPGYSNVITIKTKVPVTPPKLATSLPTNISETSVLMEGNISELGSSPILEHGFCYSKISSKPEVGNSEILNLGNKSETGRFNTPITSLEKGTLYHIRAFIKNSEGSYFYGNITSFSTKQLGLVAFYPFNNNGNDLSGNGNNGKNTSKFGLDRFQNQESALDISSGGFEAVNQDLLNYQGNLSLTFWIKNNSSLFSAGKRVLFSKMNGYCDERTDGYAYRANGYLIFFNEASLNLKIINFDNKVEEISLLGKESLSADWNHIGLVKSGNNLSVYLNGILAFQTQTKLETNAKLYSYDPKGVFMIGKVDASGCNYVNPITLLDNLKIFNSSLSSEEVFKDAQ